MSVNTTKRDLFLKAVESSGTGRWFDTREEFERFLLPKVRDADHWVIRLARENKSTHLSIALNRESGNRGVYTGHLIDPDDPESLIVYWVCAKLHLTNEDMRRVIGETPDDGRSIIILPGTPFDMMMDEAALAMLAWNYRGDLDAQKAGKS